MKVYVLAAGYATRLYPLTRDRPKALLQVGGRPILDHILERVMALPDISELVVIGNDRFAAAFESWRAGFAASVPLRVLNDGSQGDDNKLGAVGDLGFALAEVPSGDESALVVAGDNLLGFALEPAHEEFLRRDTPLLLVREVERGPGASRYNEVRLDPSESGRVTGFREKPPNPESGLAAIALYFFPSSSLARVTEYLESGGNPDAPGHFIAWLVEQTPVHAWPIGDAGEWFDIGNLETLEDARERFQEGGDA